MKKQEKNLIDRLKESVLMVVLMIYIESKNVSGLKGDKNKEKNSKTTNFINNDYNAIKN